MPILEVSQTDLEEKGYHFSYALDGDSKEYSVKLVHWQANASSLSACISYAEKHELEVDKQAQELADLHRFKALAVKCFGYPKGAEMLGWSSCDSLWFAEQFEAAKEEGA